MNHSLTADDVIRLLNLTPLTIEGGFFRETYRSPEQLARKEGARSLATAIYYLLTPDTFSQMHRVPGEEIFHFYLGDPVEMLQIAPDGSGEIIVMGTDIAAGMHPQHIVPGRFWQGARLRPKGKFALLGTTMSPGFDYADYESGKRDELLSRFPQHSAMLRVLTRE
ncbi:MAG: cupin domain-containing protein [Limisphaerales bacterium]